MSDDLPDPHPSAPVTKAVLDETVAKHEHSEKVMSWIIGTVTSGVGALVTILGLVGVLSAGIWFVLDRAEAAGAKPAASVAADLADFKVAESSRHEWTERMLFRQDQKIDAVLLGLRISNPLPLPMPPPPPVARDAGP